MCNHLRVAVPLNFLNLYISMSVCGLLEYKMFNRKKKSCNKWSEACEVVQAEILSCTAAMCLTPLIYTKHIAALTCQYLCCLSSLPVVSTPPLPESPPVDSGVICVMFTGSDELGVCCCNKSILSNWGVFLENSFSSPQISALFLP